MKTLRCKDAGIPCDYVIRGNTNDEVIQKAVEHGRSAHGMKDISPDQRSKLNSLIREESAA